MEIILGPKLRAYLIRASQNHSGCPLITPADASTFARETLSLLFPAFEFDFAQARPQSRGSITLSDLTQRANQLSEELDRLLAASGIEVGDQRNEVQQQFLETLPTTHDLLLLDAQAIFEGDPASESVEAVVLSYPGFFAIALYRIAHVLYQLKVPLLPRLLSEFAHFRTGIDIHPGATIGESFFIDHGTGIVIGETASIGNHVKLYQGVTLGALSVDKSLVGIRRHPTLEDNVVVYANATILGGTTVIGHHSVVGGNVWLTESLPANSRVQQKSEMHIRTQGK